MQRPTVQFDATLWLHDGPGGWHFVSLPEADADEIEATVGQRAGFGSIRVAARIGGSSWSTSIFPDTKRATFVLPVKRAVREAEGLTDGSQIRVTLDFVD